MNMINSFLDQVTEDVFNGKNTKSTQKRLPANLHKIAKRKLDMLNAAVVLDDLKIPPSNRLEKLVGDRKHQHSIRINDKYRIAFTWFDKHAEDIEIVDYH